MSDVLAIDPSRKTNADLIVACRDLGYLKDEDVTIDLTYGEGVFWSGWRPLWLTTNDADGRKGLWHDDFRSTGWKDDGFDVVVFDPPYKLNGTPSKGDERYGVDVPAKWRDRMQLCIDGITEAVRLVRPSGIVLVKCQAQVVSGKVRWQDRIFADHAEALGCELIDRFDFLGGRPQPEGRRQVHARRNHSTLLVLRGPR